MDDYPLIGDCGDIVQSILQPAIDTAIEFLCDMLGIPPLYGVAPWT